MNALTKVTHDELTEKGLTDEEYALLDQIWAEMDRRTETKTNHGRLSTRRKGNHMSLLQKSSRGSESS